MRHTLRTRQLMAFAFPAMPLAALYSPITVYLPPLYGAELGLGLGVVGTVFLLARLWDILIDPILGTVTDRFPSRWGRRRHWMVVSLPLLLATSTMVFFPTVVAGRTITSTYLLISLAFLYIGYTIAVLSQYSWGAELSGNYHERSRIMGWREFFHVFGMLTVLAIPAALELAQGATSLELKVQAMGVYFLVLLPVAILVAVAVVPDTKGPPAETIPWKRGLQVLLQNKPLRRLLLADLMIGIPGGVMGALYIFFITDVVGGSAWLTLILLGFFGAGLVGVPLTVRLSYKTGKHNALILCQAAMLLVTGGFLTLGRGDVVAFSILVALSGLVFSGLAVMLRAIAADVADYDEAETGERRTGLYYALLTLTNKIGYALALLSYPLLEGLGYQAGASGQPEAIAALRYTFVGFPAAALVAGMLVMWKFPLDEKRQREIRDRLARRFETAVPAPDPGALGG